MTDLPNRLGLPGTDIEALARDLIEKVPEYAKVDFKKELALQTAAERVEFCKDLSAIANTDAEPIEGYGLIIVGAERGSLLGGVTTWSVQKADSFSASLTDIAKGYLAPVPAFFFYSFVDPDKGPWGVILVPPSQAQPHIFIKELSGSPAKHEWYVRINDQTERAGALDYARVIGAAVRKAVRPLEAEVQRLAIRVDQLSDGRVGVSDLLAALNREPPLGDAADAPAADAPIMSTLRRLLVSKEARVEDILVAEALGLRRLMLDDVPENPQLFDGKTPSDLRSSLEYMERHTQAFAQAVATIARYDSQHHFDHAVVSAFNIIAERPRLTGNHWRYAQELRVYPLVLSLLSLALVSMARDDATLLRKVLDLDFRDSGSERVRLVAALSEVRAAQEVFRQVQPQQYFEPIAQRCLDIIVPWCASLIPGHASAELYYQTEFVLALEHMRLLHPNSGRAWPLSGVFRYARDGREALSRLVRRQSPTLSHVVRTDLAKRLTEFDEAMTERKIEYGSMGYDFPAMRKIWDESVRSAG